MKLSEIKEILNHMSIEEKVVQLCGVSGMDIVHLLENGTVLLPNQQNGDLVDFFDELFKFPNSTFKDMVDSFSQGVRYIDNEYISGSHGYF